jgi:hypothetical protein
MPILFWHPIALLIGAAHRITIYGKESMELTILAQVDTDYQPIQSKMLSVPAGLKTTA